MPTSQGSIRLFRIAGVDVFLHLSWFLVAIYEIPRPIGSYSSTFWGALEYLALFLIVLTHEFGHALACRQVGGKANRIVLWPLGGVAYVSPPPRPGATLWSIAAGPLVNVALLPVLLGLRAASGSLGWAHSWPDLDALLRAVAIINGGLLFFNMLPIFPLDGGQILRSLLWFVLGRARSLMVATIFGFVGLVGYFLLALAIRSVWLGILGVFLLLNCWGGLRSAQALARIAKAPRRNDFACPSCKAGPPVGENWRCTTCKQTFDTFQTRAVCPHCSTQYPVTQCFDCGNSFPFGQWAGSSAAPAGA